MGAWEALTLDVRSLEIPEVKMITPALHRDDRGFFSEVYNQRSFAQVGITADFVQDNHSLSGPQGTVRGLHFQVAPHPVSKLVRVVRGATFDVAVDLRRGSPTFGRHLCAVLSAENWAQLFVPVGFAHGFCTLEPDTEVAYKVTDYWYPEVDKGLLWNDPELGISWPVSAEQAVLSKKDRDQPPLTELPHLFAFEDPQS